MELLSRYFLGFQTLKLQVQGSFSAQTARVPPFEAKLAQEARRGRERSAISSELSRGQKKGFFSFLSRNPTAPPSATLYSRKERLLVPGAAGAHLF